MNSRSVTFKVHETFERELRTFIVEKRAVLTEPKPVMSIKVTLQRIFAAEDVLSFAQR